MWGNDPCHRGRPVREDRVRVEKAQGLTHRLGALLTHALCAEPLRPAFITPTREWSCLHHQKPPRSPAPSGSPLAPLPLGARLDPAHPVAELHRAGGVGVVSKCWPSTGCATGRGRFWCKSCDDHSPDYVERPRLSVTFLKSRRGNARPHSLPQRAYGPVRSTNHFNTSLR
jgi:hypothetical protein